MTDGLRSAMRRGRVRRLPACRLLLILAVIGLARTAPAAPNIVLLIADDLGYADLGCYGADGIKTPNLDRLAAEGIRLTNFYSAASVCSASRAALWTGCYPCRVGVAGDLRPESDEGLSSDQVTLVDLAEQVGYETALLGKWHLGSRPEFLPARHGFDLFYGIPFSHNVRPLHAVGGSSLHPNLPLYEGDRVVGRNPDMARFTANLTERAVEFIQTNRQRRFLLCVAYAMPHVPLAVTREFEGISERGVYGDAVAELDWSVGRIADALAQNGIDDKTLVVFMSDNGPALEYGDQAGSAGSLRGGKGSTFEGGMRVPCLVRWPGTVPAMAVSDELVVNFDLMPTCAQLIGARLPPGTTIDGRDLWPLLTMPSAAVSSHRFFFYYSGGALHAIRSGRWKLHFPHGYAALTGPPSDDNQPSRSSWERIGLSLFDLQTDPDETTDVAADHEDEVNYLNDLAEIARTELGDTLTRRSSRNELPRSPDLGNQAGQLGNTARQP